MNFIHHTQDYMELEYQFPIVRILRVRDAIGGARGIVSPSFSIFSIFILFAFVLLRTRARSKLKKNSITHLSPPPGPKKLPLIGNIHQLVGPTPPHHVLRDLAEKYGPVMHLLLGETEIIVVSSAESAQQVLRTHDLMFAQRPTLLSAQLNSYNFTDLVFAPHGDYWRTLRKMFMSGLLSANRVQSFKSIREDEARKLVTSISTSRETAINLSRMLYSLTYSIILRSVSSIATPSTSEEAFVSTVNEYLAAVSGTTLIDLYPSAKLLHVIGGVWPKLKRLHQEFDRILESIIKEHRDRRKTGTGSKNEDEDLVDIFLSLEEQQNLEFPISISHIKSNIHELIVAGTVTPQATVEWAMSELMRNPTAMEKTQAEVRQVFGARGCVDEADFHQLHYLKLVIKETLRLHTPIPFLIRESRHHCKINGYDLPAKSKVLVNVWAIARDPKYWNEPDLFDPERFLDSKVEYQGSGFEFLPFGAGRRMCPGMLFGMGTVELALANLLYHFDWGLPGGLRPEDLDMKEAFGAVASRRNDLMLVPVRYLHT